MNEWIGEDNEDEESLRHLKEHDDDKKREKWFFYRNISKPFFAIRIVFCFFSSSSILSVSLSAWTIFDLDFSLSISLSISLSLSLPSISFSFSIFWMFQVIHLEGTGERKLFVIFFTLFLALSCSFSPPSTSISWIFHPVELSFFRSLFFI